MLNKLRLIESDIISTTIPRILLLDFETKEIKRIYSPETESLLKEINIRRKERLCELKQFISKAYNRNIVESIFSED